MNKDIKLKTIHEDADKIYRELEIELCDNLDKAREIIFTMESLKPKDKMPYIYYIATFIINNWTDESKWSEAWLDFFLSDVKSMVMDAIKFSGIEVEMDRIKLTEDK